MALKNNDVGGGGTSRHIARERLARGATARRRVSPDRPAARRSAGGPRRGLASDPARHRCRADARPRAHAGRRGPARPRISRPLLRRLGDFRGLSARARATASRRTPLGPPRSAACRQTRSSRWRAASPAAARWSPARCRCSAPSTASSRSGWRSCWRRCSARSGCRAAALPLRWARSRTPASRRSRCRCRTCRSGATASTNSSRWRASPTCCCTRASRSTTTAGACTYPDIRLVYWAGGNPFHHHQHLERLRDAFARPDTVVVHELGVDRDRASRRYRAAGDDHAGARGYRRRRRRSAAGRDAPGGAALRARRATTTRSSPGWPSVSASPTVSPRAARRGSGCEHIYEPTRRALAERGRQRAELLRVLGSRASWSCRQRRGTAASCAPSAATPTPRRCRRRAAGSRSPRRRSPASAIPTAPATRPGWRRSRR